MCASKALLFRKKKNNLKLNSTGEKGSHNGSSLKSSMYAEFEICLIRSAEKNWLYKHHFEKVMPTNNVT